ncbi:hypothetical protein KSP39_PZI000911 [Platanthera zijinensis]|uniref:Uncharacterized protein n=1 Tax=Platanthera zijinensis TaxID=2320716 RepID=A0AAP0GF03_9ASPA
MLLLIFFSFLLFVGKIPDDWFEASDILQLRSLDRSFVFSGEQLYILVCLSTAKHNEGIINPFKFSATMNAENLDPEQDTTITKYFLQKEGHKQKTEALLESFRRSNFFVRIADSDEPLWSKRSVVEAPSTKSEMACGKVHSDVGDSKEECHNIISAVIDQGSFDCSASSGVARNNVRCCSLPSGDIVVNYNHSDATH